MTGPVVPCYLRARHFVLWSISSVVRRNVACSLILVGLCSTAAAVSDQPREVAPPVLAEGLEMVGPTLLPWRDTAALLFLARDAQNRDSQDEGQTVTLLLAPLEKRQGELSWGSLRELDSGFDFWPNWADRSRGIVAPDGSVWVHRLRRVGEGTYDYGIELLRAGSFAPSEQFERRGLLHDDRVPAEHGFVSFVSDAGSVRAFWLDGREMPSGGAMTLRTARIDAEGVRDGELLDDRVCECCATDAAAGRNGPMVVYRDRTHEEVRDISIIRRTGNGWSKAVVARDEWQIAGCPVNGPAIAAADSSVHVAWFTAARNDARVLYASSKDGGATFGRPVVLDAQGPLGRVDVAYSGDRAYALWFGRDGKRAPVRLAELAADGELEMVELGETEASRAAGFPDLMALPDGSLVAIWLDSRQAPPVLQTRVVASR